MNGRAGVNRVRPVAARYWKKKKIYKCPQMKVIPAVELYHTWIYRVKEGDILSTFKSRLKLSFLDKAYG